MRLAALLALLLTLAACGTFDNAVDRTLTRVEGDRLYMAGQITSRTPRNFRATLRAHPELETLVLLQMSGSLDHAAVRDMGRMVRAAGLDTHLTGRSRIHSGAVDLFIAGNRRSMEPGAVIGVHAWANGYGEGTSYPATARQHRPIAAYVAEMLGSPDFYWFTLQAAPSDGIHEMTGAEIARYGLLNAPVGN
jgi:hypothetical protein